MEPSPVTETHAQPEPVIRVEELTFTYPGRTGPTLHNVCWTIPEGRFVLLTGPTGCGKTTLLKALNGTIPHESSGHMRGRVRVAGKDTAVHSVYDMSRLVGMVLQNPDDQLFMTHVGDEVAFALENASVAPEEIRRRVSRALDWVGLGGYEHRSVEHLSGGQKQRVVIAAALAVQPRVLVLDEPISQLDPAGAESVLECLVRLNRAGVTIVLVEHRLADLLHRVDELVIMDEGRFVFQGDPSAAFAQENLFRRFGLNEPEPAVYARALGLHADRVPLRFEEVTAGHPPVRVRTPENGGTRPADVSIERIRLKDVRFRYRKTHAPVFDGLEATFHQGDVVAVMGQNGSGKSTLLGLIAGRWKPQKGSVAIHAEDGAQGDRAGRSPMGIVFQNPDLMLFCDTVRAEVAYGPSHDKLRGPALSARVSEILAQTNLERFSEDPPLALSRGQRFRVALASVLAMRPLVLLLDEPTTGQNKAEIHRLMEAAVQNPRATVLFCTHDIELAARYANRVLLLDGGKVLADGPPLQVLGDVDLIRSCRIRPSFALEMSRHLNLPQCVICLEDLLKAVRVAS